MIRCYLAIGTNLGDRQDNLKRCIEEIQQMKHTIYRRCSSFMENKAYGITDQPDFLNAVVEVDTELSERELLDTVKEMERRIGRKETFRWGPRVIDIDIVFYGDRIYRDDVLEIPHRDLAQRDFVLQPMMELAKDKVHPVSHRTIEELFQALKESGQ